MQPAGVESHQFFKKKQLFLQHLFPQEACAENNKDDIVGQKRANSLFWTVLKWISVFCSKHLCWFRNAVLDEQKIETSWPSVSSRRGETALHVPEAQSASLTRFPALSIGALYQNVDFRNSCTQTHGNG